MNQPFNFDSPYGAPVITKEQEEFTFEKFVEKFREGHVQEVLEDLEKHDCKGIFFLNACYYKGHLDIIKLLLDSPEVGSFNRKEFALSYLCAKEQKNDEVIEYFKENYADKVCDL